MKIKSGDVPEPYYVHENIREFLTKLNPALIAAKPSCHLLVRLPLNQLGNFPNLTY